MKKIISISLFLSIFSLFIIHHNNLNKLQSNKVQLCENINQNKITDYMEDDNGNLYVFLKNSNKWQKVSICEGTLF